MMSAGMSLEAKSEIRISKEMDRRKESKDEKGKGERIMNPMKCSYCNATIGFVPFDFNEVYLKEFLCYECYASSLDTEKENEDAVQRAFENRG